MTNLIRLILGIAIANCVPSLLNAQSYRVGEMRMFSRANCLAGVNESITWSPFSEGQKIAYLETSSMQGSSDGSYTNYYAPPKLTSRSRAGCQLCGFGHTSVIGWHYLWLPNRLPDSSYAVQANYICERNGSGNVCKITSATDCSLSAGWF